MTRIIVAAAIGVLLASPVPHAQVILEQILVKVNGDIITKTDLEERQVAYLRQQQNQEITEEMLESDEKLREILASITPRILVDSVNELLILQRARELGYRLGDEQFQNIVENIKKENNIPTDEQFEAALEAEGMTLADLRRSIERQALMTRVQQVEVFGKVGVSEEEERRYYDAHPDEFRVPAQVMLREILVEVPTTQAGALNVGLDEEAKAQADAARARVAAGEPFEKVAAEVSDAPSKANGGLIGPIQLNELAPAIRERLEGLQVGEVSEVFRTGRGYQLLKLETSSAADVQPFEQVRARIADKVYADKRRVEFEKYLEKLRSQAIIDWKNEDLRRAYEQELAKSAPATASR